MASQTDIATIVAEGLDFGGNPGLTTRATSFVKYLLLHLHRTQDWECFLKRATVQADAGDYSMISTAMPTDYRAIRQLFVDGQTEPMEQISFEDLNIQRRSDIANNVSLAGGSPVVYAVDKTSGSTVIVVSPRPNARLTYNISYYSSPDVMAYTGTTKVPLELELGLIAAVASYAEQYDQNTLQAIIAQEAKTLISEYRLNHRDQGRANVETLPWDIKTFRDGPVNE